jgi:uncharacterized protein (DUF1697 family)
VEYVALLRGINVGGHTVKMERLRELFAELGLGNVRTYIQSGNVFFETAQVDRRALTRTIEQHLRAALGYDVPVFLRTVAELEEIVANDAFGHVEVSPDTRLCVVFTSSSIPGDLALPVSSPKGDMEIIHTTEYEAYIVWHIIDGRPPAAYNFKALGNKTTTRFFHTTAKILAAAKKQ